MDTVENRTGIRYYQLLRNIHADRNFHEKVNDSNRVLGRRHVAVKVHENALRPPSLEPGWVRFVAISDTHNQHSLLQLPAGDVLLHCGDFTNLGTLEECENFCSWISNLPFADKILVPGNHDLLLDPEWYRECWQDWHGAFQPPWVVAERLVSAGVTVMKAEECVVHGFSIFGSPAQPKLPKGRKPMAFGRTRGSEMKFEWERVPRDRVDILITHTPPAGVMDTSSYNGKSIGCEELKKALQKIKPAVHVFGHVHDGHGVEITKGTTFINAAIAVGSRGEGTSLQKPIVFDMFKR